MGKILKFICLLNLCIFKEIQNYHHISTVMVMKKTIVILICLISVHNSAILQSRGHIPHCSCMPFP